MAHTPLNETDLSGQMPHEYVEQVRDALAHLYDYTHLERHRLAALIPGAPSRGEALRNLLLDTVEKLRAGDGGGEDERAWRPQTILEQRYVDGFSAEQVLGRLHISRRQFQRDLLKGVLAVATILWRRQMLDTGTALAERRDQSGLGLREEIAHLGLDMRSVDIVALVGSVISAVRMLAREHNVQLGHQQPPSAVFAWADPMLARQAILVTLDTLIGVRASQILVTYDRSSVWVLVRFALQSPPMTPSIDGSRQAQSRINTIRELMEAQGGQLDQVMSETGLSELVLALKTSRGSCVLAIDDNEHLLQLFERYLVGEGFRFDGVTSAAQALEAVDTEVPSVVLLDVMMRGIDGWEFLQRLRAMPNLRHVPIIVCSVLDEPGLACTLGAQRYLKKPVSREQLLGAIRGVLAASSREEQHGAGH